MSSKLFVGLAVVFGFASTPVWAARDELLQYPAQGVRLLTGWNTYSGVKVPSAPVCVDAGESTATGDRRFLTYREVSDRSSLTQTFSASTSAKVQMAVAKGSGSMSFERTTSLATTGLNIAVQFLILHGPTFAVAPQANAPIDVTPGETPRPIHKYLQSARESENGTAIQLKDRYATMARKNPVRFRRECGDGFVSMITPATGINGVLTADTRTENERTAVKGSFSASYLTASGTGSVSSDVAKMQSEGRLAIKYYQLGAAGTPGATDIAGFRGLIASVGQAATPTSAPPTLIAVTPYDALPNYPRAKGTATDLDVLASQALRLVTLYDYLLDANTHQSSYLFEGPVTQASVGLLEGRIHADLKSLLAALAACKPAACRFPDTDAQGQRLPRTDWDYRSDMPLRKADVAAWDALVQAKAALPTIVASRDQFPKTDRKCHHGSLKHGWKCWYDPNPNWEAWDQQRAATEQLIKQNESAVPHGEQRYQVFIKDPRMARCMDDLEDEVCIDPVDILKYKSKMEGQ
ncbi:MAG: hypothetical protein ACJ8FS_05210 [Sphingomicrobium sp.]